MKKVFIAAVSFLAIFGFVYFSTPTAKAMTIDELLAQIAALQQQIVSLQQQLAAVKGEQPAAWCHDFNANLKFADFGTEVKALRIALITEGFSGLEAMGGAYEFDEQIASAVVAFQEKYASEVLAPWGLIHGTGVVGSTTRKKLNQLYGCGVTVPPTPAPSITVLSPNGGETLSDNSNYNITWKYGGNIYSQTDILLQIFGTEGKKFNDRLIVAGVSTNKMSYSWNPKVLVSASDFPEGAAKYKILIREANDSASAVSDASDGYFSIVSGATVAGPSLSISTDANTPSTQNITVNSVNVELLKAKFTVGSAEDVKISSVQACPSSSQVFSNFQLYDGSSKIGSTIPTVSPMVGTCVDFTGLNLIIAKSTSKTLAVKADIVGTLSNAYLAIKEGGVKATGLSSGLAAAVSGSAAGNTMTIVSSGSLSLSLNVNSPAGTIASGSNKELLRVNFNTKGEDARVDFFRICALKPDNGVPLNWGTDITKIRIYEGVNQIIPDVDFDNSPLAGCTEFNKLYWIVGNTTLIVKGDIVATSTSFYMTVGAKDVKAYGVTSGNAMTVSNDVTSNTLTVGSGTTVTPSITVLSPNGGESLERGKTYTITWKSASVEKFDILLDKRLETTLQNDTSINPVVYSVTGSQYSWTVPQNLDAAGYEGQYKIIVRKACSSAVYICADAAATTVLDSSDDWFYVTAETSKPDLIVTDLNWSPSSPKSGEIISFIATVKNNSSVDVNSSFTVNLGGIASTISSLKAGATATVTASFGLTILGPNTVNVRVDIWDNISESNEQNNDFSGIVNIVAAPSITVVSPNGGEQWAFGIPQTITWKAAGIEKGQNAGVYLQFPDGGLCRVAERNALDGTQTVTLQQNQSCPNISKTLSAGQYKAFVYWESAVKDEKAKDASDNYFSVVSGGYPGFFMTPDKYSYSGGETINLKISRADNKTFPYFVDLYLVRQSDDSKTLFSKNIDVTSPTTVQIPAGEKYGVFTSSGNYTLLVCAGGEVCGSGANTNSTAIYYSAVTACTDSDGGINYYTKGITNGLASDGLKSIDTDYCTADNTLVEWYCLGDFGGAKNIYRTNTNYACSYGCSNGACLSAPIIEETPATTTDIVATTTPVTGGACTDSDGGKDIYQMGTARDADESQTDSCSVYSSNRILEWWCRDNTYVEGYYEDCPAGYSCSAGACVVGPTSSKTPENQLADISSALGKMLEEINKLLGR